MDKVLLTLTLLAFSSGVLCNVAQNLADGGPAADFVLPGTKVLADDVELYTSVDCKYNASGDFVKISDEEAYKLYNVPPVPWNQARKLCAGKGGQLAIINSLLEFNELVALMQRENVAEAWIGIHDLFERGEWVTLTGNPLAATSWDHWLSGKPDYADDNEDCGSLEYSGGLKNLACNHGRSYFCKIKLC